MAMALLILFVEKIEALFDSFFLTVNVSIPDYYGYEGKR
jgi:hypothetical protein